MNCRHVINVFYFFVAYCPQIHHSAKFVYGWINDVVCTQGSAVLFGIDSFSPGTFLYKSHLSMYRDCHYNGKTVAWLWDFLTFIMRTSTLVKGHQYIKKTCCWLCCLGLNSLWPGDAIWWHGTRSTLAQVMACCLTAPSHYLNQCWLIIGEVPWHSSQSIILGQCEDTNQ